MIAQLPHSKAARLLAVLAVALTLGLGLAGGASKPASADASQWTRNPSSWGNSTGWNRHWRSSQSGSRSQIVIGGGSGVIVTSPGFVAGSPGFVVRQPGFIVGQPGFVVRQPNFVFARPQFALKQKQFFKRHPSLFVGQPRWDKNWKHKRWNQKRWKHQMMGGMN